MRYFHDTLTREQSDAMLDRMAAALEAQGWGLWALERHDTGELIGFTGLAVPAPRPAVPAVRGGGVATGPLGLGPRASPPRRRARRCGWGSTRWGWREVVSFTVGAQHARRGR